MTHPIGAVSPSGASNCPSCGSSVLVKMAYPAIAEKSKELEVQVCQQCGFGFAPSISFDLNAYYETEYGNTHGREKLTPAYFDTIDQRKSKRVIRSKSHVTLFRDRFGEIGRVLDIGAGSGFFFYFAKAKEAYAMESDSLSQRMLESLGVKIIASLKEVENLDLIVMSHSLEHFLVEQYKHFLDDAISRLRIGGQLLIYVPPCPFLNKKFERKNSHGHEPHTLFFSAQAY